MGKLTVEPAGIEGIYVGAAKNENFKSGCYSFTCNDLQRKSLVHNDLPLPPRGIEPLLLD